MNVEVSILIPTYNSSHFLLECIGSILRQKFQNFEIVIIDDYSTDNTQIVIEQLQGLTNKIFYYKNFNEKGLIPALNYGITMCNGTFIARMDADDLMSVDRLDQQIRFLKNNLDYVGICSSMQLINENYEYLSNSILNESETTCKFMMLFCNMYVHGSMTLRKSYLPDIVYDMEYENCEDYELWIKLLDKYKIKNLTKVHHIYRIYPNPNKSKDYLKTQTINVLKLISRHLDYYEITYNERELLIHYSLFQNKVSCGTKQEIVNWLNKLFNSEHIVKNFPLSFLNHQKDRMFEQLKLNEI
ncbi:glycosyltransferase family 2 protein [Sphingobacterium sp. JUb56]|uniref:glycosyltransferase family 2 protein n=1 Tax=Sphingobacterium sp. JUb56 TaxID=2587145 RepID=UPI00160741F6|nr:glycosyltransferase family 2 protein [Sphingobacterium sp. JUb56]MBB2951170.1 glycosyltransferase involved in cell wall biosynthesis [Sphingobacterium sp. JUb56]